MSESQRPISFFDEICRLTIESMRKMDVEKLMLLRSYATQELERARLSKGCIELALALKRNDKNTGHLDMKSGRSKSLH